MSRPTSRPVSWMTRWLRVGITGAACAALAGCGLSRETLTGPAPGGPQVTGTVLRAGAAVSDIAVKLYDDPGGTLFGSEVTDGSGVYGFANVPAGRWMVKVSPSQPSDLGYVRYFFELSASGAPAEIPPFDISAHGFDLVDPVDGSIAPPPSAGTPLRMTWSPYQSTYAWTSARVSDSTGVSVWASTAAQTTEADWNGIGNDGPYAGQAVVAGRYLWRVRIRLPNGVQGATRQRVVELRNGALAATPQHTVAFRSP